MVRLGSSWDTSDHFGTPMHPEPDRGRDATAAPDVGSDAAPGRGAGGHTAAVGGPQPWERDSGSLTSWSESADRLVATLTASRGDPDPTGSAEEWGPAAGERAEDYRAWIEARGRRPVAGGDAGTTGLPDDGPLMTVVVAPVDTAPEHLDRCIRSVIVQTYRSWELLVCGGRYGSGDAPVPDALADPRVQWIGTTDRCVASGSFVVPLGADDVLEAGALARLAAEAGDPEVDVVYSDEDGLDGAGRRCRPVFKPDWDPDLLLAYPYLGDAVAYRRSLLDRLGIALPVDASARYDVALQVTEAARSVRHVPEVLYHAGAPRVDPDGVPVGAGAHETDGHRAVVDALVRQRVDADVGHGPRPGWYDVRRAVHGPARVSVIVPFRDQAGLTRTCIDSLDRAPGHPVHEVVLVDNGSVEPETTVLRRLLEHRPSTRVLDYPGVFNWAAINNMAASVCTGDMLLFVNNDIEATSEGWLQALVEQGQRGDVGAVGARLLYPDGHIQHVGVVLGIEGLAAHLFARKPPDRVAYLGWDLAVRSWTAVTGACMLVRREVFEELGGFDEGYPVAFNDVDFCLRLRDAGYRVLVTPRAELTHSESVSRGLSGYGADVQRFLARWGTTLRADDPFFNPNLSREVPWCALRGPDEDRAWRSTLDSLAPVGSSTP